MRVSITIEILEGLFTFEIFKLDNHVRIYLLYGIHKVVHEFLLDVYGRTLLSKTKIQGILQVGLVVGATVQDDGESLGRVNACGSRVQGQLANLSSVVSISPLKDLCHVSM